ncbi:ISAs1 family transposase [Rubrivirga sp. S365]|uniref:ISAs1 family transposase n=1 Tax=Rubrivirga litoralis TaxID=3075598 RepID=A0ABU3BQK9_9BACT|nr:MULTISPECIES: ISAs1 family transposase [unclassified Rubrivirga]MDT0631579.1 ISAs1 family transposase [Rubrivirga sp. F394]MDT7857224.1 ISAs1 family transposase [Rubrivirga sp. S365]
MHKKTLGSVRDAGGEWLVKLKRNAPRLYAECEAQTVGDPLSVSDTTERTRGRVVRRVVEVYAPPAWRGDWPDIGRVVRVTRSGARDGGAYERTGLYVTSRTDGAAVLGEVIRWHWHVENRLHWCKDALQNEDAGGVRSKAGAAVLSLIRGATLSVLRHNGEWSPTAARSRLANRVGTMLAILRT